MTTNPPLTPEQASALFKNLGKLTAAEKLEALDLLDKAQEHKTKNLARSNMLEFAKAVYPGFKIGPHHKKLAKIFTEVIAGTKKRVIINIAPRMGKSEFSSYLFPAFFLGNFPEKKIIMGTHTSSLSEDFGRRIRNLIETEDYQQIFSGSHRGTVTASDPPGRSTRTNSAIADSSSGTCSRISEAITTSKVPSE
jgi:site-specific DNA-adenine methylase